MHEMLQLSLPPQLSVALQQVAAGMVFDKYLVGTDGLYFRLKSNPFLGPGSRPHYPHKWMEATVFSDLWCNCLIICTSHSPSSSRNSF
jgi:hypothetical protein